MVFRYTFNKTIKAKCPRCERWHSISLEYRWIGRGTPRFFCTECKRHLGEFKRPDSMPVRRDRTFSLWDFLSHKDNDVEIIRPFGEDT